MGNYYVKSPNGDIVYQGSVLSDVESWCRGCTVFLKDTSKEVLLDVKSENINNIVEIYHGSKDIINKPYYGGGSSDNDYGKGFYCVGSSDIELAREWACSEYNLTNTGYVNKYSFDSNGLSFLNLNNFDVIYWVALTSHFRRINVQSRVRNLLEKYYLIDISNVDFIIGWRCDDTYSRIIRGFVNENFSVEAVSRAVKLGYLKNQIVIKSKKAFNRLRFLGYEKVSDFSLYRKRFKARKDTADENLYLCQRMNRNGKYINDYFKEL